MENDKPSNKPNMLVKIIKQIINKKEPANSEETNIKNKQDYKLSQKIKNCTNELASKFN